MDYMSSIFVQRNQLTNISLVINKANYNGQVTLSVSVNSPQIEVFISEIITSSNRVRLAVLAQAAPGVYTLTINATGTGVVIQPIIISMTVLGNFNPTIISTNTIYPVIQINGITKFTGVIIKGNTNIVGSIKSTNTIYQNTNVISIVKNTNIITKNALEGITTLTGTITVIPYGGALNGVTRTTGIISKNALEGVIKFTGVIS